MKLIAVHYPEPQVGRLKELSKVMDMRTTEVLRRALSEFLDRNAPVQQPKTGCAA